MPWAAIFLAVIWLLLLIPVVQTIVAFIVVLVTLPISGSIMQITKPAVDLLMEHGIRGGVAATAVCAVIVVPLALLILRNLLRSGLNEKQWYRYVNALILVVGLPATVMLAWWLLPDRLN